MENKDKKFNWENTQHTPDMQPKQMWNIFLKVKENYLQGVELSKSLIEEVESKQNLGLKDEANEYKTKALKMMFALTLMEGVLEKITMFIAKKEHDTYFKDTELEKTAYMPLYKWN